MSLVPIGGGFGGGAFGGDGPTININVNANNLNIAAQHIAQFANVAQQQMNQVNMSMAQAAQTATKAAEAVSGGGITTGALIAAQAIWAAIEKTIGTVVKLVSQLIQVTSGWHDQLVKAQALWKGMTGSAEGAASIFARARDIARDMNMSLSGAVESTQLMTVVLAKSGQGIDNLERMVDLARRLTLIAPSESALTGARGAAFALSELQAGDFQSIVRRFNLSQEQLSAAMEKAGGDIFKALDTVLNEIGATSDAAQEAFLTMQNGSQAARDALIDFADRAIGPLLDRFIIPGLFKLAEFALALGDIVERAKDLFGEFGGAGNFLADVGKVAEAILNMPGMALAPVLTVFLGHFTELDAQTATYLDVLKGLVGYILDNLVPALTRIVVQQLAGAAAMTKFIGNVEKAGASLLSMAAFIASLMGRFQIAQQLEAEAAKLDESAQVWLASSEALTSAALAAARAGAAVQTALDEARAGTLPGPGDVDISGLPQDQFGLEDLLDEWIDFNDKREQIQEDADRKIAEMQQDQTRDEMRRLDKLNRDIERSNEDFEIKRQRAAEKLGRDIADVNADAANKIAKIQHDASKDAQKAQRENNRELEQDHEDHLLKMRRMQEDHDDKVADAAARLDAVAIINENRKYAKDRRRAEEDFALEQARHQEEFAIEMQQRQSDANERIALVRDEARKRVDELRRRYELEDRLAREDQARKIARMKSDFNIEMAIRQQQLNERIAQIRDQAARETAALTEAFNKKINAELNAEQSAYAIQIQGQEASLRAFQEYWSAVQGQASATATTAKAGGTYGGITGGKLGRRQTGGIAPFTGLYHLERGEPVLSVATRRALESLMGAEFTQQRLLESMRSGGRNIQLNIPISIEGYNGDPTLLAQKIRREVDGVLVQRLRGFAGA